MKFVIKEEVFNLFPDLVVAIPIIRGFDNTKSHQEALQILRSAEKELATKMSKDDFLKDERVVSYRNCFRRFGVDPDKCLPTHVAMAARVLDGGSLPDINPMVNLYNAVSIKYLTPFGGEDLSSLFGDFVLYLARGGEQWVPIGGKQSQPAVKGELVWGDDYDVSTRALNWRQCERTKLTTEATDGYFIMDGFSTVNQENIRKAAAEFTGLAVRLFGGKAEILWLTHDNPQAGTGYQSKFLTREIRNRLDSELKTKSAKPEKTIIRKETDRMFKDGYMEHKDSLRSQIRQAIAGALVDMEPAARDVKTTDISLEHPANMQFGDFSTNIAMQVKNMVKNPKTAPPAVVQIRNPREFALKLAQKLEESGKFRKIVSKVEVAGPGFINFRLSEDYLLRRMDEACQGKALQALPLKGKKIAVEYTDPNPFKEFHLGHLYSNSIGEAVSRIFEACGATVWRGDFYGDVGMHIAKSIYGLLAMFKVESEKLKVLQGVEYLNGLKKHIDRLDKLPVSERQKILGEGYALGVNRFEEDTKVQEEVRDINYMVYVAAQEILEKKRKWKPIIDYRKYILGHEDEFEEIKTVYEAGLSWSLEYFESIYKRLGTKFDGYYPESWVGEYGMKMVEKGIAKGILEDSDGTIVYRGEKEGLHTRVFVNKLGLPTYETKDLGLAYAKYQDFPYDLSLNVFGKEIDEYYYVVKSAMKKIDPALGNKAYHLAHGMVNLPEGKMSSRSGNVKTFEWLLGEAGQRVTELMKNTQIGKDQAVNTVEKISIGAVRYALLKSNIGNDVVFDFTKSITFEGDSGPYLQYTYARCRSVMRKANNMSGKFKVESLKLNDEELAVLRVLYKFEEAVSDAAQTLSPNLVCAYLLDLAGTYNNFYNKHSILNINPKSQKELTTEHLSRQSGIHGTAENASSKTASGQPATIFRLSLTQAVSVVLKQGLHILGIETVERM